MIMKTALRCLCLLLTLLLALPLACAEGCLLYTSDAADE